MDIRDRILNFLPSDPKQAMNCVEIHKHFSDEVNSPNTISTFLSMFFKQRKKTKVKRVPNEGDGKSLWSYYRPSNCDNFGLPVKKTKSDNTINRQNKQITIGDDSITVTSPKGSITIKF